jgi:hypothetical protein
MLAGILPVRHHDFLLHSRAGNYSSVRIVSIDALIILDGLAIPELLSYLLEMICADSDPYVSYYVSQTLLNIANINSGIVAEQDWLYKEKYSGGLADAGDVNLLSNEINVYKVWNDLKVGIDGSKMLSDAVARTIEYGCFRSNCLVSVLYAM